VGIFQRDDEVVDGPGGDGDDRGNAAAALRRRRHVVGVTAAAGIGVLGASLAARPGSRRFYGLAAATALIWTAGGLASGPVPRGWSRGRDGVPRRPFAGPVLLGVGAFGAFYGAGLVARRIPPLDRAITSVLRYADQGSGGLVLATTLANGAAEEVFFRGALYAAAGRRPATVSTAAYTLATTATRNPALVLASVVMGALFARQRRATGGIQAPVLTHLTWSALMLRFLPRLFPEVRSTERTS
jgi:membrane protease YdiL (CAAX protease family)